MIYRAVLLLLMLALSSCSVLRQFSQTAPPLTTVTAASPPAVPSPPRDQPPRPIQAALAPPQPVEHTPATSPHILDNTQTVSLPPQPESPSHMHTLRYDTLNINGITITLVSFDTRQYHLKLADQFPGEKWKSAKQACLAYGGIAAINGGFFSPEGLPLGLVKSGGKKSGVWNRASSLTSGVYQLANGQASLQRNKNASNEASELLQSGPVLLENGFSTKGLSSNNPALRSILLWDGEHHFAIAHTSACSLATLAKALKLMPSYLPHKDALNLDGGRSSDFFVGDKLKQPNIQKGHWLKSNVRNYLILKRN